MMNTIESPVVMNKEKFRSYKTVRLVSKILAYILLTV